MRIILSLMLLAGLVQTAQLPESVVARYGQAIAGEAALRAVTSRITEGRFDNGRGLNVPFRIIEASPNRRVTLIGTYAIDGPMGSGRGFEGSRGWDSFR